MHVSAQEFRTDGPVHDAGTGIRFATPGFSDTVGNTQPVSINLPGFRNGAELEIPSPLEPNGVSVSFPGVINSGISSTAATDRTEFARYYYPNRNLNDPVEIMAKKGWCKPINQTQVFVLEGDCRIRQGNSVASGPRAVVWVHPEDPHRRKPKEVSIYLESEGSGNLIKLELDFEQPETFVQDRRWLSTFTTNSSINIHIESRTAAPREFPPIYTRACRFRNGGNSAIQQVQLLTPSESGFASSLSGKKAPPLRRVHYYSRNDFPMDIRHIPSEDGRSTVLITNGLNIIIEGIKSDKTDTKSLLSGDILDIKADRGLIWTENLSELRNRDVKTQTQDTDFELYLEGNIVVMQGERIIQAERMYYDAKNNVGLILKGEMLIPLEGEDGFGFEGLVRVRAEVVQQLGQGSFVAKDAFLTTSKLGEPAYRIQSRNMTIEEKGNLRYDAVSGQPLRDPGTGQAMVDKNYYLVAENNSVYMGSVPVFYWPWMATNLQESTYYISGFKYGHSSNFGHEIRTEWNPWQVFNIKNRPAGTDWDMTLEYLSKRGLGHGTNVRYSRDGFLCFPGLSAGMFDFYGIYDGGDHDNLGWERREMTFPDKYRYRVFWNHRQALAGGWILSAELGKSSDRNFMEEYFTNEWKTLKDQSTDIELKKLCANRSLNLFAGVRLDDFVTDTNWYPKVEFSWLGQSLLEDTLTWYSHTKAGIAQFKTADAPEDASDAALFTYLAWEREYLNNTELFGATSEMFSTRHEIDLPFNLGPVKVVPYALGEFAHWGKDRDEDSVNRFYGQVGIRANLPIWKMNPRYRNRLLYANGLAHKVDFNFEMLYARADIDYDRLAMYEQMDDNSIEDFRRRYSITTFGGTIPIKYDERYYAIRTGMGSNVTSPNTALADDLTLMRFGMKHRWQTKRGAVGRRHIIDWITLDTNFTIYPESDQNFGESLGMLDYDFRWYVGDRFSLLSSGVFDTFSGGQRIVRAGAQSHRPGLGSIYLGLDHIEGPLDATYFNINASYRMNEKYSVEYGTSFDIKDGRNQGQSLSIARMGESFMFSLGFSYDWSRNSVGVSLNFIPTFLYSYQNRNRDSIYQLPGVLR